MRVFSWIKRNPQTLLNVAIAAFTFVLLMMFINFNKQVAENTKAARETTMNTNKIVKNQDETLKAIKQLAADTKITAEQKTNIIICMLKVPVELRTTDTLKSCRSQAESAPPPPSLNSSSNTLQNSTSQTTKTNTTTSNQKQQSKNTGGGGTTQQTYTECVTNKDGLLSTVMGVVSCL